MLAANTFGIRGAAMVALGPSGGQHQHKPAIGVNESRHFVAAAVAVPASIAGSKKRTRPFVGRSLVRGRSNRAIRSDTATRRQHDADRDRRRDRQPRRGASN
ncbi:hypothetical protein [Burkholderia dolosa]|uniref:hypothetical protein n=1 Tax=Burkholderia dolosa TaxID=152500 RepID=UPI0015908EC2|nr:hypothetical protein [Burkholderia dolosa]MBR8059536.1 hypothetical protein [Burkholderia dolosa]MBY4755397.1 hypothetical protein [Burkholderia dolosa]